MEEKITPSPKNGFQLISKYRGALMGIASIWVFVFHAWISVFPEPQTQFLQTMADIELFVRKLGYTGVDTFLLLSGMGLTYAIKKEPLLKFYYRRIRKVILPFAVAAVISFFVMGWDTATFVGNITGFNFYAKHINCFCWFVPAIITLYLFFPLYWKVFDKVSNKFVVTGFALLIWLMLTFLFSGTIRYDLFGFTNRIPVFLIGILFGYIAQNKSSKPFKATHYLVVFLVFLLGLFLEYIYIFKGFSLVLPEEKVFVPNCVLQCSMPFLISKILDILDSHCGKFGKAVTAVFGFWGTFTLEMYCSYACLLVPFFTPVVLALKDHGFGRLGVNIAVFAATSLVSWLASLAFKYFWKLVELPFGKKNEQKA